MRRTVLLAAAALTIFVCAPGAQAPLPASAIITAAAIWHPPPGFVAAAHAACDSKPQVDYGDCFIGQMQQAGAPPDAVALAHRLNGQPGGRGTPGIVRDVRESGAVDIAIVDFPLRANQSQGILLVNGSPSIIDVDDPAQLPEAGLERVATYAALARRYPSISLWPGSRAGTRFVQLRARRGGGQRFILRYVLRNGCHACAVVGSVSIGFDFDANGSLVGPRVIDVRAARRR